MQHTDIPMRPTTGAADEPNPQLAARRFVAALLACRVDKVRAEPIEGGVRVSVPDSIDTTGVGAILQWHRRDARAVDFAVRPGRRLYDELVDRASRVSGWAEATADGTTQPVLYVRLALAAVDRDAGAGQRVDEGADAG